MNKTLILAAALGLGFATTASAQMGPMGDPFGDATVSRADMENQAMNAFKMLDGNGDGSVTQDELPGPGGQMFSRLDVNGDGKVTADEFKQLQGRRFEMMDANKDGQLTKAERDAFREAMRARMGGGN